MTKRYRRVVAAGWWLGAALAGCSKEASPAVDADSPDGGTSPSALCAAPPTIQGDLSPAWALSLGAGTAGGALALPSGRIVVAGSFAHELRVGDQTFPTNPGSTVNPFLLTLDQDGRVLWERTFPGEWVPADVGADAAGDLFVAGEVPSDVDAIDLGMGPVPGPLVIARFDADGNTVWHRGAEGIFSIPFTRATTLAVSAAGDVAVMGIFSDGATDGSYVARLDSSGGLLWSKSVAELLAETALAFDGQGDLLVGGTFSGGLDLGATPAVAAYLTGFVATLDATGSVRSLRMLGDSSAVTALAAAGQRAWLAGTFNAPFTLDGSAAAPTGRQDLFAASIDDSGAAVPGPAALATFPAGHDRFAAIAPDGSGGSVVVGEINDYVSLGAGLLSPTSLLIARLDAGGQPTTTATFDAPAGAHGRSVSVDSAGGVVAFGTFRAAIDLGAGLFTADRADVSETMFVARYTLAAPGSGEARAPCPPLASGALLSRTGAAVGPERLVLHGDTLYFATDTEVMSIPVAGGAPTVLVSGQNNIVDLAADDQTLFWANAGTPSELGPGHDGAILSMPLGGGPVAVVAGGQDGPRALAVDETNVYWTIAGRFYPTAAGQPPPDGQLLALAKTAGPTDEATPLASTLLAPGPIAAEAGTAVVASRLLNLSGWQIASGTAGGSAQPLATTDREVTSLALAGGTVFWTDADQAIFDTATDDGRIRSVPLAGGAAAMLLEGRLAPGFIVPIGADLYWGEQGQFKNDEPSGHAGIWRAAADGGTGATVVDNLAGLTAFSADDAHIVWVELLDGNNGDWALRARAR